MISYCLEKMASLLTMPFTLMALNHKRLFYLLLFSAPLMPMPDAFSIAGIPPTAIIVALILFSILINLPVNGDFYHSFDKLNKIGIFVFLFAMLLFFDFYHVLKGDMAKELPYLMGKIIFIGIALITYLYIDSREEYLKATTLLVFGVIILSILTIISSFLGVEYIGGPRMGPRTYGITMPFNKACGIPMSYGEYGIITMFALPIFLTEITRKMKILGDIKNSYIFLIILLWAIFITQSRSTWLATVITLMVFYVFMSEGKLMLRLFTIAILGLLFIIFFNEVRPIFHALAGKGVYLHNIIGRIESYFYALSIMKDNTLFGYGHSKYQLMHAIYTHFKGITCLHNNFLHQLVSCGILGFLPYIAMYILVICGLIQNVFGIMDHTLRILNVCLLSSIAGSMVELNFYRGYFSEVLAIEIGLALVLTRNRFAVSE